MSRDTPKKPENELSGSLVRPLREKNLEAALEAARDYQKRNRMDPEAEATVEALELLMSQLWLQGAPPEADRDPALLEAAQNLRNAPLSDAYSTYSAMAEGGSARAGKLAQAISIIQEVQAHNEGIAFESPSESPPIPGSEKSKENVFRVPSVSDVYGTPTRAVHSSPSAPPASVESVTTLHHRSEPPTSLNSPGEPATALNAPSEPATALNAPKEPATEFNAPHQRRTAVDAGSLSDGPISDALEIPITIDFEETTRIADRLDLPIYYDEEETSAGFHKIPAAAFRSYRAPRTPVVESTRVLEPGELELAQNFEEVTRVAAPGDLPLAELKRQLAAEKIAEARARAAEAQAAEAQAAERVQQASLVSEQALISEAADSDFSQLPPPDDRSIDSSTDIITEQEMEGAMLAPEPVAQLPGERWEVREPAAGGEERRGVQVGSVESSWTGVRLYADPSTSVSLFDPPPGPGQADQWGDTTDISAEDPYLRADTLVREGRLGEALGIYQDLAEQAPGDMALQRRVEEIALLLQQRSKV